MIIKFLWLVLLGTVKKLTRGAQSIKSWGYYWLKASVVFRGTVIVLILQDYLGGVHDVVRSLCSVILALLPLVGYYIWLKKKKSLKSLTPGEIVALEIYEIYLPVRRLIVVWGIFWVFFWYGFLGLDLRYQLGILAMICLVPKLIEYLLSRKIFLKFVIVVF